MRCWDGRRLRGGRQPLVCAVKGRAPVSPSRRPLPAPDSSAKPRMRKALLAKTIPRPEQSRRSAAAPDERSVARIKPSKSIPSAPLSPFRPRFHARALPAHLKEEVVGVALLLLLLLLGRRGRRRPKRLASFFLLNLSHRLPSSDSSCRGRGRRRRARLAKRTERGRPEVVEAAKPTAAGGRLARSRGRRGAARFGSGGDGAGSGVRGSGSVVGLVGGSAVRLSRLVESHHGCGRSSCSGSCGRGRVEKVEKVGRWGRRRWRSGGRSGWLRRKSRGRRGRLEVVKVVIERGRSGSRR